MTSPKAEEADLRPSEWWAQLKAQQQRWSVPPLPPNRSKRNYRRLIAITSAVIVVAAVGGVVWAVEANNSDSKTGAAAVDTSTAPVPPHATVAGWQVVVNAVPDDAAASGAAGTVAVDVPAGWTIAPITGADGRTTVRATFGDGACVGLPQSRRAAVTQTVDATAGQDKAVAAIVQTFLHDTGYANYRPQVAIGSPHPTKDGSFQDYKVTVTMVPPPPPGPPVPPPPPGAPVPPPAPQALAVPPAPPGCIPPTEIVHVVAKSSQDGTFAVLIAGDQQVAGAAAATDLDKIAATVRTAGTS